MNIIKRPIRCSISILSYSSTLYTGMLSLIHQDGEKETLDIFYTDISANTAERAAMLVYSSMVNVYHNIAVNVVVVNKEGMKERVFSLEEVIKNAVERDLEYTPEIRTLH